MRAGVVMLLLMSPYLAAAVIGDWGHFISYQPKIYLANAAGRPFTFDVHVMRWPIPAWNQATAKLRLTDPAGAVVVDDTVELIDGSAQVRVPATLGGTYVLETEGNFWLETTLRQAVLWTGDCAAEAHAIEGRRAVFQAAVPRRWWFWVPDGVTGFTCRAQRADRYMSQREDWGFFIISPRGQRIRALWGQPAQTPRHDYRRTQEVQVEVEPGAGGRFWSLEVQLGDSHNYSNINFCLDGVPPYLARSPEEWFDPATGAPPEVPLYDDDPFIQSGRLEAVMAARWPDLQHFSPCPALGDPDGIEILGDADFALWNPQGRELGFRIGSYLPRTKPPPPAVVRITGPDVRFQQTMPLEHIHHDNGVPRDRLPGSKGVLTARVTGAERFFCYTYPATPLVLLGSRSTDGWDRFHLTACAPRNWYFLVPPATVSFAVRAAADYETDVLQLEVCAPDRIMALIYGNRGEQTIAVPAGLDGKIWYFRPSVGSATLMRTGDEQPRYQDLPMTLDVRGLPPRLSPTWEQWFDPDDPRPPAERTARP